LCLAVSGCSGAPDSQPEHELLTVTQEFLTELHYRVPSSRTAYKVDHTFGFVRVAGVWKIDSDELDIPPGPGAARALRAGSDRVDPVRYRLRSRGRAPERR
jgi:hypothetical protein